MTAGIRILIIEDSNIVRLEVKRILEQYGIEVIELNNAEDFFQYPYRFKNINLLILDINLPGLDGLTALEKLRHYPQWAYLPVIMLSGRCDAHTVHRALQAGAVNYLRKPFDSRELLARIEQALGPRIMGKEVKKATQEIDVNKIVSQEISRAKRGSDYLSLIELHMLPDSTIASDSGIVEIMERLKSQLREIDTVLLKDERNILLILPLTNKKGSDVVVAKISKWLEEQYKQKIPLAAVTYPEDGATAEDLLKKFA